MPNERISMSKWRQVIGLQASNLSVREICGSRLCSVVLSSANLQRAHFAKCLKYK